MNATLIPQQNDFRAERHFIFLELLEKIKQLVSKHALLGCTLFFSLLLAGIVEHRVFTDPTALNDDLRNQIYWMSRVVDPSLFPHDTIANYFSQRGFVSPVLWGTFRLFSSWMSPISFSQYLPFVLVAFTSFFLFKTVETQSDSKFAFWATLIFNIYLWTTKTMAGGLPRAFFYPLLFSFLWAMHQRRWAWMILVTSLQCCIYPVCFFLSWCLLLFHATRRSLKPSIRLRTQIIVLSLVLGSGLGLMGYRYFSSASQASRNGSVITLQQALQMPEFYKGGRIILFPLDYIHKTASLQNELPIAPNNNVLKKMFSKKALSYWLTTVVSILCFFFYNRFLKNRLGTLLWPQWLPSIVISSLLLFGLAYCTLFYLYLPIRYVQYTVPLVGVFLVANLFYRLQHATRYANISIAIGLSLLIIVISPLWRGDLTQPAPRILALSTYFSHTPKTTLIAAPLDVANEIPVYAKRSVFLSTEANIPFHQNYYQEIKRRTQAWLEAYYAVNPAPIFQFLHQYPIQYLVIRPNDFSETALKQLPQTYFHAFSPAFFSQIITASKAHPRLFNQRLESCHAIKIADYEVIPTANILKENCMGSVTLSDASLNSPKP